MVTYKNPLNVFETNDQIVSQIKTVSFDYDKLSISNVSRQSNTLTVDCTPKSGAILTYKDFNFTYKCTPDKIYFSNTLQYISGVTIDGEMVIHNKAVSSGGSHFTDIYMVFPLHQSNVSKLTELDNILTNSALKETTLDLNKLITDNLCIQYESVMPSRTSRTAPDSIVILFVEPILVRLIPTINYSNASLFKLQHDEYSLIKAKILTTEGFSVGDFDWFSKGATLKVTEGFKEGLESQDVNRMLSNMECEWIPYDMSGNQESVNTFMVESTFYSDKTTNNAIVMMKYFLFFIFIILIIYFSVPMFYMFFGIRVIMNFDDLNDSLRLLGGMELFFDFLLFIIIIIFLTLTYVYPKSQHVKTYNMIGFFTLIFWLIAYLLMEIQKTTTSLLRPITGDTQFRAGDMPPFSHRVGAIAEVIPNFIRNLANDVQHIAKPK